MRQEDVKTLLDETSELLDVLSKEKETAKTDSSIISISKPKVKSVLEHTRSVLEYIALDTFELLQARYITDGITGINTKERDIYFPIFEKPTEFRGKIHQNFRHLDTLYPEIFTLIESIQPFNGNNDWLKKLNKHTNSNKHNKLSEQEKYTLSKVTHISNLISVTAENATMKDNVINGVLESGGEIKSGKPIGFNKNWKTDSKDYFRFKGSLFEIVGQVQLFHEKTSKFSDDFYKLL